MQNSLRFDRSRIHIPKALVCPTLADVSLWEMTEFEFTAVRHSGYGISITTFDLDRLSRAKQTALDVLRERVI